jgi:hypothetical protein
VATKRKPGAKRGRPPVPTLLDPDRFKVAMWCALHADGSSELEASRLALLMTDPAPEGGRITITDIEGVLHRASATIPLPPFDPANPYKGELALAAKAKRAKPEPWLVCSSDLLQQLFENIRKKDTLAVAVAGRGLAMLGWEPTIMRLLQRIGAALQSNLPPDDLTALSPKARKAAERAGVKVPKRRHRGKK